MVIINAERLAELLKQVEPQAPVYRMENGEYVPVLTEGVQIVEDDGIVDVDGLSVPVGAVVLV